MTNTQTPDPKQEPAKEETPAVPAAPAQKDGEGEQ